jgi:hypothetical protein
MGPDRGLNPGPRPNRPSYSEEREETLRANHTARPSGLDVTERENGAPDVRKRFFRY